MTEEKNVLDRPIPAAILATLIVFSIITFSLETLPDLDSTTRRLLDYCEYAIVAVFTAEYLYRLSTSSNRLKFITSPQGLIDLIAILPFYLSLAIDLRSLRAIRLLRLVRLLKLARYSAAFDRLAQALTECKYELLVSVSILAIAIYLSAFGIYHFEHAAQPEKFRSIFDALWWSVVTITTVGYGEIYPITLGGRIFGLLVMLAGLGIVAVPSGIFATALISVKHQRNEI